MAQPDRFAALRRFFRIFNNPLPKNRFQDSFGAPISDFNNQSRWALAGTAAQVWDKTIRPLIDDLVLQNESRIYRNWKIRDTTAIRHCWMIGPDQEQASPTIVIGCNARPILKRMMRMLVEDETIKREGFKVLGTAMKDLQLTATRSAQSEWEESRDPSPSEPKSISGVRIIAERTGREATIGGAIVVDGCYYGLTVAHAFTLDNAFASDPSTHPEKLTVYDSDWAFQSDDDDDESQDEDAQSGNHIVEEHRYSRSSPSVLAMSNSGTALSYKNPYPGHIASTGQSKSQELSVSYISSSRENEMGFDGLDWAMMKLDGPALNIVSGLHSRSFKRKPPSGRVLLRSGNEQIYGSGSGSTCSIKVKGSNVSRGVWSASFDQIPGPGCSGAWVIDASDGDIYGVLFACSASLNEGYIVPFHLVLDSIMTITNASKIALPSRSIAENAINIHTNSFLHAVNVKGYCQKRKCQNSQESAHPSSWEEDKSICCEDVVTTRASYLSTFDVSCLIINKMVGTGVFTAPHAVFLLVGAKTVAFTLWILGFIFTLISLMIYLSYGIPYSGGELIYLDSVISRSSNAKTKSSLPKSIGFIFDCINHVLRSGLFSYVVYAAIFLTSANSGLSSLQFSRQILTTSMYEAGPGPDERSVRLLALMLLVVTYLIFCFSSILGQRLSQLAAMVKVALLTGSVVAGMLTCLDVVDGLGLDILADDIHWRNVPAAFLLVLFSFQGWDAATLVAGEISPNRQSVLRRQSLLVVGVVGVFYLCINTAFLYVTSSSPIYGPNSVALFETPRWIDFNNFNTTRMPAIESPFVVSILQNYLFVPNSIMSFNQTAWPILITLSSLGTMMATLYTSSRVAQEIEAANILPWSRLLRNNSSTRFYSTYLKQTTSRGLLLYFFTSFALLAIAILSESLNATSSLYYLSTFAQCNWILILTLALWRHKGSGDHGYLIHFGYCIFILSTLFVIIGVGIPSNSPAGTTFAGWKLQLMTVTIIGIATVYYLLVFASASIYDSSGEKWREPSVWRWSVLGIAGVKCEIRLEEDLVQGTGLKHRSRRRATFLKCDLSLEKEPLY